MTTQDTRITASGIYRMPEAEYHGDSFPAPCLSAGVMKTLLLKSPKHAWVGHPALNPDYVEEVKEQFDIGRTAHAILLEGTDNVAVIDAPDWRTKDAQAQRGEARANGCIPLLAHHYKMVKAMVNAAQAQLFASELAITDLQAQGDSELSWIWQEEDTWLKVRPDWISSDRDIILDYKTTGTSANPEGIARHILSMGYDIQEALYRRGVTALSRTSPRFIFMFQETEPPYLCSFVAIPPQWQEMGQWKVERGIALWQECMKANSWPGYPSRLCYPDLPAYAYAQWQSDICVEEDL